MDGYLRDFLLAFLPLLVAIDAIGTVPVLPGIVGDRPLSDRVRITNAALLTAFLVGFGFLFLGHMVLRFLGIHIEHFAIAGGLILLVLGVQKIVSSKPQEVPDRDELLAVVPIGTPLTAGQATLATLLPYQTASRCLWSAMPSPPTRP